ncbi:MAG: hypothetical protein WCP20_18565 [Desulfuromonadales bacterium]
MKQATVADSSDILHKLESIEKELSGIKLAILKRLTPARNKVVSLRGMIKGIDVTDDDIAAAKHSLYSAIKLFAYSSKPSIGSGLLKK